MMTLQNETNAAPPIPAAPSRPSMTHRVSAVAAWLSALMLVGGVVLAGVAPTMTTVVGMLIFLGFFGLIAALITFFVTRSSGTPQPAGSKPRRVWGSSNYSSTDSDFEFLLALFLFPFFVWMFFTSVFRPQAQKTLERFLTTLSAGDVAGAQNLATDVFGLNAASFATAAPYVSAYRGMSEVQVRDAQPGNPQAGKSITGMANFGDAGKAPLSAVVVVTQQGWRVVRLSIAAPSK